MASSRVMTIFYAIARQVARSGAPCGPPQRVNGRTSAWPLLLGLVIAGFGVFLGYAVSVGPHCDGAFAVQTTF